MMSVFVVMGQDVYTRSTCNSVIKYFYTFRLEFKKTSINSHMGSFLEFIFSKFCLFCFLLAFLRHVLKESIDGAAD